MVSKVDLHVYLSKNIKSMGFHKVSIFCVVRQKVVFFDKNYYVHNYRHKIPGENPPNGTGASLRVSMLDIFPYARSFTRVELWLWIFENQIF